MMAYPMFMIVQNLRFFLTDVAPTAVIFGNKFISYQFRHLGISQMMVPVYLYICELVYLCTSKLVNLCFCVHLYLFTGVLVNWQSWVSVY